MMLQRTLESILFSRLQQFPAVALLGPRQIGKTTLAYTIAEKIPHIYLDLESPTDRNKLTEAELYLEQYANKLVIIDEVQRYSELFQILRTLIDKGRRRGLTAGRFLLLGSASNDLLHQSGESLAGRICYLELSGLNLLEVSAEKCNPLWLRGGFPDSFLAADDLLSLTWRESFIRTYLERDIPSLGPRIPAETLRRFWTMLAHHQGGLLNAAQLASGLAVDGKTIARYLDLLVDLLLVRRLPAWHSNQGKRLVKSPKVYVRDSGITHALLGLSTYDQLMGHPIIGMSWEGFIIENLLSLPTTNMTASFYRTSAGAEIDLLLEFQGGELWAIEIKRSITPKLEKGFHIACEDLKPARCFVVYPGNERYPVTATVEAISIVELMREIQLRGGCMSRK